MSAHPNLVVVGLDESIASRAALEFALDEGVAHGYAVEVVTAWLWSSPYAGMETVSTIAEGQQVATAVQEKALREALVKRSDSPSISQTVVHADAGRALVERARDAAMLVVGNSRKGALIRTVLGSVSQHCVQHSSSPVVVVAARDARARSGRQGQVATT